MKASILALLLLVSAVAARAAKPTEIPGAATEELKNRLESTIVPKVEYREAGITEIADDLAKRSMDLDPAKVGFTIKLSPNARNAQQKITLSLSNIPAIELIKYVTNLAGLKYQLAKDNVVFLDVVAK